MDIDFLKSIGQNDSFPVSIDSSRRDLRIFPEPSEYEVEFDEPFKNVVGFDVLDATIPNSMYTVDTHNNVFSFVVSLYGLDAAQKTLDEYFSDLAQADEFLMVWNDAGYTQLRMKIPGSLLDMDVLFENGGDNLVTDFLPDTDTVLMDRNLTVFHAPGSLVEVLAVEPLSLDPGASYQIYENVAQDLLYVIDNNSVDKQPRILPKFRFGSDDVRVLISATESTGLGETVKRYATVLVSDLLETPVSKGSTMTFAAFAGGRIDQIASYGVFRVTSDFYDGMTSFHHELNFFNLVIDPGNHDFTSLVKAFENVMPSYVPSGTASNVPIMNLSSPSAVDPSDFSKVQKIKFSSVFRFWLDMEKSTIKDVIGFSSLAFDNAPGYSPLRIGNNLRVFAATAQGTSSFTIVTPGLITFIGERLVVLRCPQIEAHAYPSLMHSKDSAGIGVFKLYDTTFAHLRFDFTKLARLDFHPIGKLPKLKFRFERINGELYDFKGVNHHLFLNIKFLYPRNERSLPPPHMRLNPDYDPNTLRYLTNTKEELDELDTESDDALLEDREHNRRYLERRRSMTLKREMEAIRYQKASLGSGSSSGSDDYETSESSDSDSDDESDQISPNT